MEVKLLLTEIQDLLARPSSGDGGYGSSFYRFVVESDGDGRATMLVTK